MVAYFLAIEIDVTNEKKDPPLQKPQGWGTRHAAEVRFDVHGVADLVSHG